MAQPTANTPANPDQIGTNPQPNTGSGIEILRVRIVSPRQTLFEGTAKSVSSTNSVGKFDVLPEHANFVTLIQNSPIVIIKEDKQNISFSFPLAILYAANNKVNIYTDIQLEKISPD